MWVNKIMDGSRQTNLCVNSAGEASSYSRVTGCVLQAETGLVSLSDLLSRGGVQQVIVTKGLHAVVMPGDRKTHKVSWRSASLLSSSAYIDGTVAKNIFHLMLITSYSLKKKSCCIVVYFLTSNILFDQTQHTAIINWHIPIYEVRSGQSRTSLPTLNWVVRFVYNNSELTDDSCAIPTHAWASPGGSLLFLGSSPAVGTAAGLCNRDLSHSDDTQTWGKETQWAKLTSSIFNMSKNN